MKRWSIGALVAAALNLPAEHRDYVAARLLLDALPNPPFHLPATAAGRPVTRTIQLGQGTAATTTASLWLPTRGSRLPGIVIAVGAAPLGRHDPHVVQLARAFVRAGRAVLVPDLTLRTGTLDAADLQRVTAAFQALAAMPRVDPRRVGLLGISWGGALAVGAAPPGRRLPVGAGYSVTSCDLRILTDQSTEPISPYDPPSRQDSS